MVLDASRNSKQPAADAAPAAELFGELDPEPRLLMGPGPVDVHPRVLRAMSVPLLGQFDPQFTGYMTEVMALYRQVFRTATSGPSSSTAPPGRASRPASSRCSRPATSCWCRSSGGSATSGRDRRALRAEVPRSRRVGPVFEPDAIEAAIVHAPAAACSPSVTATPRPPCCSRWTRSARCVAGTTYCSMSTATASLGGNAFETDAWGIDVASRRAAEVPRAARRALRRSPSTMRGRRDRERRKQSRRASRRRARGRRRPASSARTTSTSP